MKKGVSLLIISTCLLLILGCSQHRLDFDKDQLALTSCHERVSIRHVNIRSADENSLGYEIRVQRGKWGSNIVYLDKENANYDANDEQFRLEPNKEYIITSVHDDTRLEMRIFTNLEGLVDSVANDYGCSD